MTQSAAPAADREASVGRLNYLDSSTPSSLYRNGKMLLRRNADGSDSALEGVVFDECQVTVHNARLLEGSQRRTVEKNGFELLFRPLAQSKGQRPDSDDPQAPCTFSFHSSFDDASPPPNAPARWSIEAGALSCTSKQTMSVREDIGKLLEKRKKIRPLFYGQCPAWKRPVPHRVLSA